MSKDLYEIRGLKFLSRSSAVAMDHMCTFAISLRLPSGSYWVAYYKWQENTGAGDNLTAVGDVKVIATGARAVPSLVYFDGGMVPKDLLEYESTGTLEYIREKHNQFVWVKITATGQKHQVLRFRLVEPSAPTASEHLTWKGRIGLWRQTLERSATGSPPHSYFSAK